MATVTKVYGVDSEIQNQAPLGSGERFDGDVVTSNEDLDAFVAPIYNGHVQFGDSDGKSVSESIRRSLLRYLLDTPSGSIVTSVKVLAKVSNPFPSQSPAQSVALKFGLLRVGDNTKHDSVHPEYTIPGPWAARGSSVIPIVHDEVQVAAAHYNDSITLLPDSSPALGGVSFTARGPRHGITSMGYVIKAQEDHQLAQIRMRLGLVGSTGPADLAVVMELRNVISDADRRPVGSPFATTTPVLWNSLTPFPDNNPDNWFIFPFSPTVTITSGQLYAVQFVEQGQNRQPLDSNGRLRTVIDHGTIVSGPSRGDPSASSLNPHSGLWFGVGGFSLHAYFRQISTPQPTSVIGGAVNPGLLHGDTLVPPGPVVSAVWLEDETVHYGEPLPATGDQNFLISGMVQMIQDWIDSTDTGQGDPYTSGDQITCLVLEPFTPVDLLQTRTFYGKDIDGIGVRLEITYEEPTPCDWLDTKAGPDWAAAAAGPDWLDTKAGPDWLATKAAPNWAAAASGAGWFTEQECD